MLLLIGYHATQNSLLSTPTLMPIVISKFHPGVHYSGLCCHSNSAPCQLQQSLGLGTAYFAGTSDRAPSRSLVESKSGDNAVEY